MQMRFLKSTPIFRKIKITDEDYPYARKLESESNYRIAFYDCVHIAICKRLNLTLVTRDRKLIEFSRLYIEADRPENLIQ